MEGDLAASDTVCEDRGPSLRQVSVQLSCSLHVCILVPGAGVQ